MGLQGRLPGARPLIHFSAKIADVLAGTFNVSPACVPSPKEIVADPTAFVSVTVAHGPFKQPQKFQHAIAGIAEIQECHTVTGEADYLLKVVAPDLKSFSSFLMERLTHLFDITNTTSMLSLEELKQTSSLPIREK